MEWSITGRETERENCWYECNERGGRCHQACGDAGFCCSRSKHHANPGANGDCPAQAVLQLENGLAYADHHMCVFPSMASLWPNYSQCGLIDQ